MDIIQAQSSLTGERCFGQTQIPGIVSVATPDDVRFWEEGLSASTVEHAMGHDAAAPMSVNVVHRSRQFASTSFHAEPDESCI